MEPDPHAAGKLANGMMVKTINNNNNVEPDSQAITNDIVALIDNEIPECQQSLKDNHRNLERVAEYCDTNYFGSSNKFAALEETKSYTTQSLASVAYQITSLAFNILHLLDLQATLVTNLETQANHLKQTEQIHREKVARREIGLFTVNKRPNRIPKIIYPANPEKPRKYVSKPIDYSILDDVGHGLKLEPPQAEVGIVRPQQMIQNIYSTGTMRQSTLPRLPPPPPPQPPPPPPTFGVPSEPDWVPANYIEKVVAIYDYTKEKPDELDLCENSIIYVTKKNEDGWYEGVLDGEEGLFPSNYVEPLREGPKYMH